jgi:hypothetical protein
MTEQQHRRASWPAQLRVAGSTLLLTGVASAATVLVLTQASSVFNDGSPGRAPSIWNVRALPPITVPVAPSPTTKTLGGPDQQPSSSPAGGPTAAPQPSPWVAPLPTPAATPGSRTSGTGRPTPTGQPTPEHTPTAQPTPVGTDTPSRQPLVSLGEVGSAISKGVDNSPSSQQLRLLPNAGVAIGEVGRMATCSPTATHCPTGYDATSPSAASAVTAPTASGAGSSVSVKGRVAHPAVTTAGGTQATTSQVASAVTKDSATKHASKHAVTKKHSASTKHAASKHAATNKHSASKHSASKRSATK